MYAIKLAIARLYHNNETVYVVMLLCLVAVVCLQQCVVVCVSVSAGVLWYVLIVFAKYEPSSVIYQASLPP